MDLEARNAAASIGIICETASQLSRWPKLPVDYVIAHQSLVNRELVQELQTWCKDRLERYQYPHRVDFVAELPKTMTGKIQRYLLREEP